MDEVTPSPDPVPPRGLLADHPLKVNPVIAWIYRKVWDLRHPSTRFLFFATTGRSGTGTFARILDGCPDVRAWHEARPKMDGEILVARQAGRGAVAAREYWTRKSVNIRRGVTDAAWYAEANHLFIKSFAEYVLKDLGRRVSVVHLRRDPVEVAASMARLPEIPGTPEGARWYLDWRLDGNLVVARDLLEDGAAFDGAFDRCLWYWYEIEARVRRFREEHPRIPVHEFSWSERIDPARVCELLDRLGLEHDSRCVAEVCEVRVNTKADEKRAFATRAPKEHGDDLRTLRARHAEFRARLSERIPDPPEFAAGGD